jgi:hypothetical protein
MKTKASNQLKLQNRISLLDLLITSLILFASIPAFSLPESTGSIDSPVMYQVSYYSISSTGSIGFWTQPDNDSLTVLVNCLGLPVLRSYMPKNPDGSLKQIIIIKYPVSFSKDQELSEEGKRMIFMSPSEIRESKIEAYVAVRSLKIEELSATVNLNLFYDYDPVNLKYTFKQVLVKLVKAGGIWKVENSTIK